MNILQKIFNDHYEEMLYILHPRSSVTWNVDKMINCGNPAFGGAMFGCSTCGELKFSPFRCHGRFCPTCGNMYSLNKKSRDCVFTAPELEYYNKLFYNNLVSFFISFIIVFYWGSNCIINYITLVCKN